MVADMSIRDLAVQHELWAGSELIVSNTISNCASRTKS